MDASQEEPCVICLEHIKDKAIIKGCSHIFCVMCIRNWAHTNTTCPLCKHPFDVIVLPSAEEEVIAPASRTVSPRRIEEELQCLDHSFFLGEVQRLLQDAERLHLKLHQESRSQRLARWERDRFEALEVLVSELRTHKRRLQSLLQFDPHSALQDLYRIQDTLQDVWLSDGRYPPVSGSGREDAAPVRYGADDADNISDDEDYADDMAYLSISKTNRKMVTPKKKAVVSMPVAPTPSKKSKRKERAKQQLAM